MPIRSFVRYSLLAAALILQGCSAFHPGFNSWLEDVKIEARGKGISEATINDAFANVKAPVERARTLEKTQPEKTKTLDEYLASTISTARIRKGQSMMAENRMLLSDVSATYGVEPQFIAALWGIESDYGHITGSFYEIQVLATLAYNGNRPDFFRSELMNALVILDQKNIPAANLKGSWAGAMGQCQFMPSTYLNYAADYNDDNKRDIWNNKGDVFASIANYLKALGWKNGEGWGRKVTLPADFDTSLIDIAQTKTYSEWQTLGLRGSSGNALPANDIPVSLILIGEGDDAKPYLVTGNFKALLKWNRSRYFAVSVGVLADSIIHEQ